MKSLHLWLDKNVYGSLRCCFLEVDLGELHEFQSNHRLALGKLEIKKVMLCYHQLQIGDDYHIDISNVKKPKLMLKKFLASSAKKVSVSLQKLET